MKIQYASDLHLDFYQDKGRDLLKRLVRFEVAPILVLAGDTSELVNRNGEFGKFPEANMKFLCDNFERVFFVLGNHEHYHVRNTRETFDFVSGIDANIGNFYWLHNCHTVYEGIKFGGTTLWFRDDPLNCCYEKELNDFSQIPGFKPWVYEENQRAIDFVSASEVDVMITHHLPSYAAISSQYKGDPLNRFYVCDVLDREMREKKLPKAWIHGHSHDSLDMMFDTMRLVRNPADYRQANPLFNFSAFVEV